MEIVLNKLDVESDVTAVKGNASQLALPALGAELSGQSEALEKFVSVYQEFTDITASYLTVLNTDLKHVSQAVCTLEQTDRKQQQNLTVLGAAAGMAAGR